MIVTDITTTQFSPERIQGPADLEAETGVKSRRSAGLHVSQIYRDIENTLDRPDERDMGRQELQCYQAGGFLWEIVFSQALAQSFHSGDIVRPGEFMVDGIIGSPDNWDIRTGRVIETKCTWRSARKFDNLEKYFRVWLWQIAGYCKLLGTEEAELYVYFVNGNYAPPAPKVAAKLLVWTPMEIEENWRMLKGHAQRKGWI